MLGRGRENWRGGHQWHLWSRQLHDWERMRCFPKEPAETAQLKHRVQAVQPVETAQLKQQVQAVQPWAQAVQL